MAVTGVSATNQDTVNPLLESSENEMGINPSGTGYTNYPQGGRMLEPAYAADVSTGITTPVTGKTEYFRLPVFVYRHAASTSANNC